MEAEELRQFSAEDLKGRIRQWREELFRSRFKAESSEAKDTSVFKKLRRDIARGLTILHQKTQDAPVVPKAPQAQQPVVKAEAVAEKAEMSAAPVEDKAEKKPSKKSDAKKPTAKKAKAKE